MARSRQPITIHGITFGKFYRVDAVSAGEYLTLGKVYAADHVSETSIGLHSPIDGAGTFIRTSSLRCGLVTLTEVVEVTL